MGLFRHGRLNQAIEIRDRGTTAFVAVLGIQARAQGKGRVTQKISDRQAVTGHLDAPVEYVEQGGQKRMIPRRCGVDQLCQKGAADDDLAPGFPFATVDRPQGFEPFDPSLENGEPFGVVGDLIERTGMAATVNSTASLVPKRGLQGFQARLKVSFLIDLIAGFAVVCPGLP